MRKKMIIIPFVAILLLIIIGALMWHFMGAPLYAPGMVRAQKNLRGPLEPPPQSAESGFWLVEDDIRLHFTAQGQGRPLLVMHGGPGYPVHRPLAGLSALEKDHQILCYDQRGCGRSTRPFDRFASTSFYAKMKSLEQTLGIGAQVADVERIRRILGEEKLILMGHSFGAFLATMYAAEFPERVEALVLVAPAGVLVLPDPESDFFGQIRERLPASRRTEYDAFLNSYLDFGAVFSKSESEWAAMNRQVGEYFLAASGQADDARDVTVPGDNGGWMVQAMYFSMGKRHDYRPALKKVRAPALIIHGESDLIPEHVSRLYADCLPNSRLHVMKNGRTRGGHFPFSEAPEAFAEVVRDFLAQRR
jgi:proline iminopeptidase